MNLSGPDQMEQNLVNVFPLFGNINQDDLVSDLIAEAMILDTEVEAEEIELTPRKVVRENQFPDQSMFILEEQLSNLRSNLNRMKFYLGDIEDIIPG